MSAAAPGDRTDAGRVLVIIPTYNEATTLPEALARVRTAVPTAEILVVDDDSPDGTGDLAEAASGPDASIHVLHRTTKEGLGKAYIAGFTWALARGYDTVVEMDADGSHRAVDLPRLLAPLRQESGAEPVAVVIGSRWVPGGEVENWPVHRKLLSQGANLYVRIALGIGVRDATAGFRAYRASTLRALPLDEVSSQGYCFQVDMSWRVRRAGGRIVEVPIVFVERLHGESKMSGAIIAEALVRVTGWAIAYRWGRLRSALTRRPAASPAPDSTMPRTGGPGHR